MDDDPHLDGKALPITDELTARLERWADAFAATLNLDDPARGTFSSKHERRISLKDFYSEGEEIWRELRRQLGPKYCGT